MNLVLHLVLLMAIIVQVKMIKLIIDTDGVTDDVRAISLALQHPDVKVIAFTTTHGCVNVSQATANVARTQRANGVHNIFNPIPIYEGSAGPIISKQYPDNLTHFFGRDGLGDTSKTFPKSLQSDYAAKEAEHAVHALIRLTKEHSDITLVCLGPLTNIALALKMDPTFASRPLKVVLMGGNYLGIGNSNATSSAEYNFYGDPEAAAIVLSDMRSSITVVPWEAFFVDGEEHEKEVDFNEHLNFKTALSRYLSDITHLGRTIWEKRKRQYAYIDEIAMATAIDPDNVIKAKKNLRVAVELAGKYTRGQVVVDWTKRTWGAESSLLKQSDALSPRDVTVVTSYNAKYLNEMMNNAARNARISIIEEIFQEHKQ